MAAMWDEWKDYEVSNGLISQRIRGACASLGWRYAIQTILDRHLPFHELKVIELGCGTGTFSLCFRLLGAETTLIDANEHALRVAEAFFKSCGVTGRYLQADLLEELPSYLLGRFDLVTSGGLIEHFTGDDRELSVRRHASLLSPRGFCMIAVPNRFSPFYRAIRTYRELTGTWGMDVEVPYSYGELRSLAGRTGFSRAHILGKYSLPSDLSDYSKGFVSATLDLLPPWFRAKVHRLRSRLEPLMGRDAGAVSPAQIVSDSVGLIRQDAEKITPDSMPRDYLGANIFLIGFKGAVSTGNS